MATYFFPQISASVKRDWVGYRVFNLPTIKRGRLTVGQLPIECVPEDELTNQNSFYLASEVQQAC